MDRLIDTGEIARQVFIRRDSPAAETLEQTILHFGGGGLGIGDAQDALRLRAIEQQPGDAVDQGRGLARTGIGGQEGRGFRISGYILRVHSEGSSSGDSSSPNTLHS